MTLSGLTLTTFVWTRIEVVQGIGRVNVSWPFHWGFPPPLKFICCSLKTSKTRSGGSTRYTWTHLSMSIKLPLRSSYNMHNSKDPFSLLVWNNLTSINLSEGTSMFFHDDKASCAWDYNNTHETKERDLSKHCMPVCTLPHSAAAQTLTLSCNEVSFISVFAFLTVHRGNPHGSHFTSKWTVFYVLLGSFVIFIIMFLRLLY